jgi:RNA polymerase sigma-70 factor (ECF subfamily)
MIDHIRKHKKVELKDDFSDDNRTQYIQDDGVKKTLMQALNRLNQTQKSLVMLKDYEGYSYAEIGKIMSLNESQVKVYLHRARLTLKNYLVNRENV